MASESCPHCSFEVSADERVCPHCQKILKPEYCCTNCGANWSRGEYSEECEQCGGGSMTRSCVFCGGKCGGTSKRMVMDSWDFNSAHWLIECKLPPDEQYEIKARMLKEAQEQEGRGRSDSG